MASKYPISQLDIGDSFTFPSSLVGSVNNAALIHRRKFPGKRFSIKKALDKPGRHRCKRIDGLEAEPEFEIERDGPVEM